MRYGPMQMDKGLSSTISIAATIAVAQGAVYLLLSEVLTSVLQPEFAQQDALLAAIFVPGLFGIVYAGLKHKCVDVQMVLVGLANALLAGFECASVLGNTALAVTALIFGITALVASVFLGGDAT